MSDSENRILDAKEWEHVADLTAVASRHKAAVNALRADREALRAALTEAQDALDATPPHKRAWRFDVQRLTVALVTAEAERDDIIVRYGNSERVWLDERRERLAAEARVAALTAAIRRVQHEWETQDEGWRERVVDEFARALLVGEPDPETSNIPSVDPNDAMIAKLERRGRGLT